MKKTTDERRQPARERGVLPATPGKEPDLGAGILPGTLAEKREDDRSRTKE